MPEFYSSQSALRRAYLRADVNREKRLEVAAWQTYQERQEEEAKKDNEWGIIGRVVGAVGGFFVGGLPGAKAGWQIGGTGADAARVFGAGPDQFDDIAYLKSQPFLQGGKFNRFQDHALVSQQISAQEEFELAEKLDVGLSLVQSAMTIIGSVQEGPEKHLLTDKEGQRWSAEEWRKGKVVTDSTTGIESVEKLGWFEKIGLTVREASKSEMDKYMEFYNSIFGKPFANQETGEEIDMDRSIGINAPNSAFNKEFAERVRNEFEGMPNWSWTKFEAARQRSYMLSNYDKVPEELQTLSPADLTDEQKVEGALINFELAMPEEDFGPLYNQNAIIPPNVINDINDWADNGPNPNNPIARKGVVTPLMPTSPLGMKYPKWGVEPLGGIEPLEYEGPPMSSYMKRKEEGKFLWKDFFGDKDKIEYEGPPEDIGVKTPIMNIPEKDIPYGMATDLDQRSIKSALKKLDHVDEYTIKEQRAWEEKYDRYFLDQGLVPQTDDDFFGDKPFATPDEDIIIRETALEVLDDWKPPGDVWKTGSGYEIGGITGNAEMQNWLYSLGPDQWKDIDKIYEYINLYGIENMDAKNPPIGLGLTDPGFYQDIMNKIATGIISKGQQQ